VDFSNVSLEHFIIHQVGNSFEPTALILSEKELEINDDELKQVLLSYFLTSFKPGAFYEFDVESSVQHPMKNYSQEIFQNNENFLSASCKIAQWLQKTSQHPNIKTGELYIALFKNCLIDGQVTDCLGIFKSESKDVFLKIYRSEDQFVTGFDHGINIRKLDKGCLIFNTRAEQGYKITIVDKVNKSEEALYWRFDFLNLRQISDNYYQTEFLLQVCKQFSNDVLTEDNQVDKAQQIAFNQRSQEYFKTSERFDQEEFNQKVIGHPEAINAFEEYKKHFEENYGVEFAEEFPISKPAVIKSKRYFRPVIKLDRNFHVYVHGNPDFVERGWDPVKQMKYYKLYYNEEI